MEGNCQVIGCKATMLVEYTPCPRYLETIEFPYPDTLSARNPLSAPEMTKPTGEFERDASNRLCYEMFDVDAINYPKLVSRIVEHFNLRSTSDLVVGPDQLIGGYSDGKCSIGLEWDNWSGFIVTAHSPNAEPLVKSIGAFLSDG